MYIAQSLDDESQSLPIIAHTSQQEYHFQNKVSFIAYLIRLSKLDQVSSIKFEKRSLLLLGYSNYSLEGSQ